MNTTEFKKEKVKGYVAFHQNTVVFLDGCFMRIDVVKNSDIVFPVFPERIISDFLQNVAPKISKKQVFNMYKNNGIDYLDGHINMYINESYGDDGKNYNFCTDVEEFLYDCDFEYKSSDYVIPEDACLNDYYIDAPDHISKVDNINGYDSLIYLD